MHTLRIILILLAVAAIAPCPCDADAGQGKGSKANTCVKGRFPATGQTTAYTADTQTTQGATVPDDGTVQAGAPLSYTDNGDGTITDNNTGLMWEKKSYDGSLHDMQTTYAWSNYGTVTIWDWLAQVNAEGGTGFAGYSDWRIPNVKELVSIIDFGETYPVFSSAFNTGCTVGCTVFTCSCTRLDAAWYWTSTTADPSYQDSTFRVKADIGQISFWVSNKTTTDGPVRAVRGGCVKK